MPLNCGLKNMNARRSSTHARAEAPINMRSFCHQARPVFLRVETFVSTFEEPAALDWMLSETNVVSAEEEDDVTLESEV